MEATIFEHGRNLNSQGSCLGDSLDRLEEVINIKIAADSFCDFFAIFVLIVISGLPQGLIGAARRGSGTEYVHLHLVLLRFIVEVLTPPQEPICIAVFCRDLNLVEHLFYVCSDGNFFLSEPHKDGC